MKLKLTSVITLFALGILAIPAHAQQPAPQATLTWGAVTVPTSAALTYKVQRATAASGPWTQIANPSGTTYVDTSVARGTTYFWRILSSCPATGAGCGTAASPVNGDSTPGAAASATIPNASTPPPVPQNLTITEVQ